MSGSPSNPKRFQQKKFKMNSKIIKARKQLLKAKIINSSLVSRPKNIQLNLSSINMLYDDIQQKSKQGLKCSFPSNSKIDNIINQLYPKLDELEDQKNTERSVNFKTKRENEKLLDSYTSQRKMENKMIMNNAQRQLNQRIRNKMIEKSKRGDRNSFNSQSYLDFYKRIKSQDNFHIQSIYEKEENSIATTQDGIKYYSQLKLRPTILNYALDKIKQKEVQRKSKQQEGSPDSFLNLLEKRKKKVTDSEDGVSLTEKWAQDIYQEQIMNINKISHKLKKMYEKKPHHELDDNQIREMKKSNIIRHQHEILNRLSESSNKQKISKKNKISLMNKFNEILNQYGKSASKREQLASQLKLNKELKIYTEQANNLLQSTASEQIEVKKNQRSMTIS